MSGPGWGNARADELSDADDDTTLLINEPKFVDEFDDEALKFLTLVDGWSLSACPALVVCCA